MDAPAATSDAQAGALAMLRLQAEWGADEALLDLAVDRLRPGQEGASGVGATPATPSRAGAPGPWPARPDAPPATPAAMADGPAAGRPAGGAAVDAAAGAATLDALLAAWAGFEGCALRRTAASTVLPWGDPAAGLLLVGEAPDADDDRAGTPYAGATGAYLDRMLASIGLARPALRIAFLVPWRPPGGRPPNESELRACAPFLLRYLALAPPARLLLLGNAPARTLLGGQDGARRARGRWRSAAAGLDRPVPALVTHAPAQVRATPALRRDAWADLLLLRHALDTEGPD